MKRACAKVGLLPIAEDELPPQKRRKVSTAEAQRRRERRERRGIRELSLPLRSLRLCGEGIGIAVDRLGQQADAQRERVTGVASGSKDGGAAVMTMPLMKP